MAGVTESKQGSHATVTEAGATTPNTLTATVMSTIARAEGEASRSLLAEQLDELRRLVLGLEIGLEEELETPGR